MCDLTSGPQVHHLYNEELGPFHQELSALSPEERHYHYPGLNTQAESQQSHHQRGSFVSSDRHTNQNWLKHTENTLANVSKSCENLIKLQVWFYPGLNSSRYNLLSSLLSIIQLSPILLSYW